MNLQARMSRMARTRKEDEENDVLPAPGLCPDASKTPHAPCGALPGRRLWLFLENRRVTILQKGRVVRGIRAIRAEKVLL